MDPPHSPVLAGVGAAIVLVSAAYGIYKAARNSGLGALVGGKSTQKEPTNAEQQQVPIAPAPTQVPEPQQQPTPVSGQQLPQQNTLLNYLHIIFGPVKNIFVPMPAYAGEVRADTIQSASNIGNGLGARSPGIANATGLLRMAWSWMRTRAQKIAGAVVVVNGAQQVISSEQGKAAERKRAAKPGNSKGVSANSS